MIRTHRKEVIKVGILVSYDYENIYNSLPIIYNDVDSITLAVDINYRTWSGNYFDIKQDFFKWIEEIDVDDKINIYKDDFYIGIDVRPMVADTRERNMLANVMGKGGWHIQLDADEFFINFKEFVSILRKIPSRNKQDVDIYCNFIPLYKQDENGYYLIDFKKHVKQSVPIATNKPNYKVARLSDNLRISFDFNMIHNSWARNEQDLYYKLKNWGHAKDFDVDSYFEKWKKLNNYNYKEYINFHPFFPHSWPGLRYVKAKNIMEVINIITKTTTVKSLSFFAITKLLMYRLGILKYFLKNK